MKILNLLVTFLFLSSVLFCQEIKIPASYSNIGYDENGIYYRTDSMRHYADPVKPKYTISALMGNPVGTNDGIIFEFGDFEGTITYGLIPYNQVKHPLPIFRFTKEIVSGKVAVNIKNDFRYPYDFVAWKERAMLTIGYRLTSKTGSIVYDGEVGLTGTGPFKIAPAISEGPFISKVSDQEATIWFHTTTSVKCAVEVDGKVITEPEAGTSHIFTITSLKSGRKYPYKVIYGDFSQQYEFTTAPKAGDRKPFVFGYCSDSRSATGGGERNIFGANVYVMKKIGALAQQQNVAFMQFTGDMINGYLNNKEEMLLQYTNWKKAVEPFWHYTPYYTTMGNHEALGYIFKDKAGSRVAFIEKFPYNTESAEAIFGQAFVNHENGPSGEDGSKYDPDLQNLDFPSYKENVYYYTYGNVAMVVLNSDYWFAPTLSGNVSTSGGLHAYIMDNQLKWLQEVISKLEKDKTIDHIFVTQHTPAFPNGGHSGDDMWYHGNNDKRTYVAGKPVEKGIIERRDEYLDILANQSTKVVAILTGDEHNYNHMKITNEVPIYPENYPHKKLSFKRPIYQVNNGAAGAPYYAQEVLPWSAHTKSFSVENALCLFYVNGKKIEMRVINPDTLNELDYLKLR